MPYRIQWRYYRRPFLRPLRTGAAHWPIREGILLRLEDDHGQLSFGELAPVPWFPVESLDDALGFLSTLGQTYKPDENPIPPGLPCTAFALGSALLGFSDTAPPHPRTLHSTALLPAGDQALDELARRLDEGYSTLKWKIGVYDRDDEWRWAEQLFRSIHGRGILRLDANGSLSPEDFHGWARFLQEFPVEFFEQALPAGNESQAHDIAGEFGLTLAWDESACTLATLTLLAERHPEAVFVIKPSQAGDPGALQNWLASRSRVRRVYSSSMETRIGFNAVCRFAMTDSHASEAAGLGTASLFPDDCYAPFAHGPEIHPKDCSRQTEEELWRQL